MNKTFFVSQHINIVYFYSIVNKNKFNELKSHNKIKVLNGTHGDQNDLEPGYRNELEILRTHHGERCFESSSSVCKTLFLTPLRESPPAICIMHPGHPVITKSAPLFIIESHFREFIASEVP